MLARVTRTPAIKTPNAIEMKLLALFKPSIHAINVAVYAPVIGNGMAVNMHNARYP